MGTFLKNGAPPRAASNALLRIIKIDVHIRIANPVRDSRSWCRRSFAFGVEIDVVIIHVFTPSLDESVLDIKAIRFASMQCAGDDR